MANDDRGQSPGKPHILKRFANLDIDGVPKPRRRRTEREEPAPRERAEATSGQFRGMRREAPEPTPVDPVEARRTQARALRSQRRRGEAAPPTRPGTIPGESFAFPPGWDPSQGPPRMVEPEPEPTPRSRPAQTRERPPARPWQGPTPTVERVTLSRRGPQARSSEPPRRAAMTVDVSPLVEVSPFLRAGVMTVEVELGRRPDAREIAPMPPSRGVVRRIEPMERGDGAPIGVTELAARQIRMMAYQQGVMGAALRLQCSGPGGPEHTELIFDTDDPGRDDVVFLTWGLRVIVDRRDLETLRGTRITYSDLPGAEGFSIR